MQQQRLAQEMQDATVVSIIQKRPKMKASRSLPAMVLKSGQKTTCRVSERGSGGSGGGVGGGGGGGQNPPSALEFADWLLQFIGFFFAKKYNMLMHASSPPPPPPPFTKSLDPPLGREETGG